MKCKLCGKAFEDKELFFCTGCGAMLKNPATGEPVPENREDDEIPEDAAVTTEEASTEITADINETEVPEPAVEISIPQPEEPIIEIPEAVTEPAQPEESITEAPANPDIKPFTEPVIPMEREKNDAPVFGNAPEPYMPSDEQPMDDVYDPSVPLNEQPVITEEKPKNIKVGAARLTGAAIVSFFTAIILLALSILGSLKLGLTPGMLQKSVEHMDTWTLINGKLNGISVSDNIYNETDFDKATHNAADKASFAMYLSKTNITEFLGEKIHAYADYILNGNGEAPTITVNEAVEFFRSNSAESEATFNYQMQTADYNSIRSSLEDRETADKLSVTKIGWDLKFRLENVKFILSGITIGIVGALVLVLLIWIALIVNRKGRHLLGFYGVIFSWSGAVTLLVAIAISAGAAVAYIITAEFAFYACAMLLLPTAVYGACIGAIELIAGTIFRRIKRAIRLKAKRNAAVEKALDQLRIKN